MPEKVLKKLNSYILPQWKVCFFASLVIGIIAHAYKITNWLPNWDSLVFRYDAQNMVGLGRWFLPVVCAFGSFYDLPYLGGITAIVFHGLGAVCICKLLGVEKKITAALIGGIIVSFPAVTSVMMYNYVADGYSIAFFMSALAALLMTGKKPLYLVSAVLIALSAGIYQAYITVTVTLLLLYLIDEIIYNNASFATVLKKGMLMLVTGIAGMVIYSVLLKVILAVSSSTLLDYQGINDAASMSNIDLIGSLYNIKETFFQFFFCMSAGLSFYIVLNILIVLIAVFYYVKYIVVNIVYKKSVNIFMLAVLSIMVVLGAGALAFVNAGVDYHNLMLMGFSVFYIFFVILYERGTDNSHRQAVTRCWVILLTSAAIIANQVVVANVSYHKAQIAYEKSYGVLMRIADRIEQTDGSDTCNRIMVIGALDNSGDYSVNLPPDITGITDGYIIRADDETVGQSVLCSAINDYCDKDYEFVSGDEKTQLMQKKEIEDMNHWPLENCVAVVDDTIVIKLGAEGEI